MLNVDPILAPLGNYGGPTQTMALQAGSPAIDAGSASIPGVTVPMVDQRGAIRGPSGLNAGANPDIGAFEASSSYLVTTAADSDDVGTLRSAVGWANVSTNNNPANLSPNPTAPNTIVFDTSGAFSTPQAITLLPSLGTLNLTNTSVPEAINGPGASIVTVSGGGQVQVFDVPSRVTATIAGLTIANGYAANGGGIYDAGTLAVNSSTISDNSANSNGGGIYDVGTLAVNNSTISDNSANTDGGAIFGGGGVTLTNSTSSSNAAEYGGAVYDAGPLTLTNSTLSTNSASNKGGGIYNTSAGQLIAVNCTIASNFVGGSGSGGGLETLSERKPVLVNTIIALNSRVPALAPPPATFPALST